MTDIKEIIRVLGFIQEYFDNHADEQEPDCRKELFRDWSEITLDAITLLKVQKTESVDAPKPDSDIGCWYDITHNYTLEQVVSALKAQEPVKLTTKNGAYFCGNPHCRKIIAQMVPCGAPTHRAKYCSKCGQAVKWE